MKILLCHNYYRIRGGEDLSYESEARMLEEAGHEVLKFQRHNDSITGQPAWQTSWKAIWNSETYREVRELLACHRPDVMHSTNTFPLLSPSIHYAAAAEGVPVVQSLRNYRLACVNSYLLRENQVCESCLGRSVAWPGVLHGCYRDGRLASAAVALMLACHRLARTWHKKVSLFYTPSEFARGKLLAAGLPANRVAVKPNFVHPDPGAGSGRGGYALFAGRLSGEKGIELLLEAWQRLPRPIPLRIAGEGPLEDRVRSAAQRSAFVEYLGPRRHEEVLELMGEAAFVVFPSLWYETFGRIIMEAYAKGTPVVAARLGAMTELIEEGRTGWLFCAGDVEDLCGRLQTAIAASRHTSIRQAARHCYRAKYTAAANLPMLLSIYERVIRREDAESAIRPLHSLAASTNTEHTGRRPGSRNLVPLPVLPEAGLLQLPVTPAEPFETPTHSSR